MPEQEMFEKRRRFATFLTSSHSFLMGNLSQFFASYNAKYLYSGEKNNSNPSLIETHVLIYNLFVCALRCGWEVGGKIIRKRGKRNNKVSIVCSTQPTMDTYSSAIEVSGEHSPLPRKIAFPAKIQCEC